MKSSTSSNCVVGLSTKCDYCGLAISNSSGSDQPIYCCFGCRFAAGISDRGHDSGQNLGPATAFGLSVFFTINVVMMTMALWSCAENGTSAFEASLRNFLRYGAMMFSAPVMLLLGRPLFSHAIQSLRRSVFTTDLLLSIGVAAAFAVSVANTLRDSGHVYYEVACVILTLVTLGRWLEAAGRTNALETLSHLERLVPESVRRWDGARFVQFPRIQVQIGDNLRVLAGERIPVDGVVSKGRTVVDEQFFTGESAPVEKQSGDKLLGGSLNLDGDIVLVVTSTSAEGALARLISAVHEARMSKGRYQLLSDTWSQWFFPIIGAIAVLTFVIHGMRVDWEYGLLTSLSVLLIACPCALALATPLAVWSALAAAARAGVLFRSGEALESLAAIRAIRWDKTGTLTTGQPRVTKLLCEDNDEELEVERLAVTLAEGSNHIYSNAISEYLSDTFFPRETLGVTTVPGRGLLATAPSGQVVRLGSIRWLNESGVHCGPRLAEILQAVCETVPLVAISKGQHLRGLFLLEETIRPEATEAVARCRVLGLTQAILTGDVLQRTSNLVTGLSIPIESKLLPEEKLTSIRQAHAKHGRVAMVGDGLNDAPALAAADIGIALGCGADVSRDSADVCLLTSDLRLIPWAYEFSQQAVRTIRKNLAWSFGYNSVGVVFAAFGQLHPAMAAALMVISSLMVLGNSLRLANHQVDFSADQRTSWGYHPASGRNLSDDPAEATS